MDLVQDALVTSIAFGAGWLIVRRVFGFVRPKRAQPGCAHCPSATTAPRLTADEQPLVFIKHPPR